MNVRICDAYVNIYAQPHENVSVCIYTVNSSLYLWGFFYFQFFTVLQKMLIFSPQPREQSVEYWTEYKKKSSKIIIFTQPVIQQKLSFPSQNIRCHHDNLLWQTLALAGLAQISVRCWSEWIQLGFLIHSVVFGKQWFVQSQTEIILYMEGGEGGLS